MRLNRLVPTVISLSVALVLVASSVAAAREPSGAAFSGSFVLKGRGAAAFRLPSDTRLVYTWRDALHGLTYERYQQFLQPYDAHVVGAQLTIVRRAGNAVLVAGAHYPLVTASNRLLIDGKRAIGLALASRTALADISAPVLQTLQSTAQLRVDPATGRLSQRVESGAPGVHVIHDIDAETGAVIDGWDTLAHVSPGIGTGVRGDRKNLLGGAGTSDDLTKFASGGWRMQSVDGRIQTYDAKKSNSYYSGISVMADNLKPAWGNDNDWAAPYERAAVDAQYYANLTDDFYRDPTNVGGYDYLAPCSDGNGGSISYGPVRIVVHYGIGYANAFWDSSAGGHFVFGDGDGFTVGPLSGGQDIVSHEMTHRVTECRTPDLAQNYWGMPGALNEALSDIMASSMEWKFNEPTSSNCRRQPGQTGCPDWWEGEDGIIAGSDFGFRNLADPETAGQPGHWQDHTSFAYPYGPDNGGVHLNSTIPSHAFYLMANGGRNARCSGPTDPQTDCDVVVPAIPLAEATQIFFAAWGTLTENATFCETHDRTVDAAETLFPGDDLHRAAAELAWSAVGRGQADCHATPATEDFSISLGERSIALAPGGSGQLAVTLTRGASLNGKVDFAAGGASPATTLLTPEQSAAPGADDSAVLDVSVPAAMADGIYPIVVSATDTDSAVTHYASAVLVVDSTPPTVGISSVDLPTSGQILTNGAVLLRILWSATDAASGVDTAALKESGNPISSAGSHGGAVNLLAGGNSYSFQVTATDAVGNSAASDPSNWTVGRFQESAATYSGSWSAMPGSQNWGSVRYSGSHGASATFAFNGTDVAWISTRGTNRGKAKVYLDGVLITKVDTYATSASARRIVFAAINLVAGPHTLKIVVSGTSGRPRVDLDGIVTLGQ